MNRNDTDVEFVQQADSLLVHTSETLDERDLGQIQFALYVLPPLIYAGLLMIYENLLGTVVPAESLLSILPVIIFAYLAYCTLSTGIREVNVHSSE